MKGNFILYYYMLNLLLYGKKSCIIPHINLEYPVLLAEQTQEFILIVNGRLIILTSWKCQLGNSLSVHGSVYHLDGPRTNCKQSKH